MSARVRMVLWAAVAGMTLVALAAIVWKWPLLAGLGALEDPAARRRVTGQIAVLLLCPLWLGGGWLLASRRLTRGVPTPSLEHVRWLEAGLMAAALMLAAMQAWTARNFIAGEMIGHGAMIRFVTIFAGALVAVQGNFIGKVGAPRGEGAPKPAVWTRMMLRIGRVMALIGIGIVVAALTLPLRPLFVVTMAAALMLVANSALQRRALRAPGARA